MIVRRAGGVPPDIGRNMNSETVLAPGYSGAFARSVAVYRCSQISGTANWKSPRSELNVRLEASAPPAGGATDATGAAAAVVSAAADGVPRPQAASVTRPKR
jgi:hypothetical protein